MGRCIFDDKLLIPCPLVTIQKNYVRIGGEQGEIVSSNYDVTLNGTIVAYKGSPNSDGVFWDTSGYPPDENIPTESRLASILSKQKAIQELFNKNNEGKTLEIQSDDGSQPLKMYPKIVNVAFAENIWHDVCPYTITLSVDRIFPLEEEFEFNINSASETWSLEPQEVPESYDLETNTVSHYNYFKLIHNVSAEGIRLYDEDGNLIKEPWQSAKDWCLSRLGITNASNIIASSGVNYIPSSFTGKDHFRSENADTAAGQFSVVETWTLTSGYAIEDFNISQVNSINDALPTITIDGSIKGLEVKGSGMEVLTTRYQNAESYFNNIKDFKLFNRAQTVFGSKPLNSIPISTNISRNPLNGVINYNYEYNARPSGLIPGALSEIINVNYTDGGESFASVFALGRKDGPVLQDLGTKEARTKTLNIDAILEVDFNPNNLIGTFSFPYHKISDIVNELDPVNEGAYISFRSPDSRNYTPATGVLNYSVTWTYEEEE